jgi:hypothetical protein
VLHGEHKFVLRPGVVSGLFGVVNHVGLSVAELDYQRCDRKK